MSDFDAFEQKMRAAGMGDAPVAVFKRNYEALLRNETGMIPEALGLMLKLLNGSKHIAKIQNRFFR